MVNLIVILYIKYTPSEIAIIMETTMISKELKTCAHKGPR